METNPSYYARLSSLPIALLHPVSPIPPLLTWQPGRLSFWMEPPGLFLWYSGRFYLSCSVDWEKGWSFWLLYLLKSSGCVRVCGCGCGCGCACACVRACVRLYWYMYQLTLMWLVSFPNWYRNQTRTTAVLLQYYDIISSVVGHSYPS